MHALKVGLTSRLPGALTSQLREQFPAIEFAGPGLEAPFQTGDANVILGWPKPDFVRAAGSLKWIYYRSRHRHRRFPLTRRSAALLSPMRAALSLPQHRRTRPWR